MNAPLLSLWQIWSLCLSAGQVLSSLHKQILELPFEIHHTFQTKFDNSDHSAFVMLFGVQWPCIVTYVAQCVKQQQLSPVVVEELSGAFLAQFSNEFLFLKCAIRVNNRVSWRVHNQNNVPKRCFLYQFLRQDLLLIFFIPLL